jgi:CubicO group peptidase (beta-lactamase class C family)
MKQLIRSNPTLLALTLFLLPLAVPARAADTPPTDAAARAGLEAFMERAAAEGFRGAVAVTRGGETLLSAGYGQTNPGDPDASRPIDAQTVSTTGSITKQFTGAAILKLAEAGKLSVDDPITKYFEGVPADKRGITIHHLLTHTAGFPGGIGRDSERVGRDEYLRRALDTELLHPPGERYEYSNVGYSLAAAIVEIVSGRGYEEFLRAELFDPAGMEDTGYHRPWDPARLAHGVTDDGSDWGTVVERSIVDGGPGWHLLGNGGIHSTPGDMMRWHRALQGDRILSAASKQKLYGKHVEEGGGTWYGYGWSIEPTPWGEAVAHNGGNGFYFADFVRFPEDDVAVYLWTTSREGRLEDLARPLARIVFTGEAPEIRPAKGAMEAPGSGRPAAPGTAAARWQLPGTPAGERAGELLTALTGMDEAGRRAWVPEAFASEVIERRGVDGLVSITGRLAVDAGDFTVRGFRAGPNGGEHQVGVVLERAGGPPMEISVEVEPEAPHRLSGVGVEVGG